MNVLLRSVLWLGVCSGSIYPALSQEPTPTPRPPIGPKTLDSGAMIPPGADLQYSRTPPIVPSDRARIQNIGDQTLYVSYWDGDSVWKTMAISPKQSADVICIRCGASITLAFHNGVDNRVVPIKTGGNYMLFWSTQVGLWDITAR
jgi:hypothetical protein